MPSNLHFFAALCILSAASAVDIPAAAAATKKHEVLVEALKKAKLVTTLQGTGPFTVFAPTDTAFTTALTALKITREELLARADLADILKYHVLSGKIMAADLKATQSPATLQGKKVTITKADTGVKFATAKVTTADVACDNGVIHVIDTVIMPPVDIIATAVAAGQFKVLAEALETAKLVTTLRGDGPFTVFAPTDDAFTAALTALKIDKKALLAKADLADILKNHVLKGKIMAADLKATQSPDTLNGKKVTITKSMFGDAKITSTDNVASNGVIHVIDKVVLPAATTTAKPGAAISVISSSIGTVAGCASLLMAMLCYL